MHKDMIESTVPVKQLHFVNAVPCRIAFERGKERHFCFLAISVGTCGWLVLAEELPLKKPFGVVRVAAPLAGSNPRIDDKHPKWLHLRIRPSSLPILDPAKFNIHGKLKTRAFVDGRWTLAFRDGESCKSALCMIVEEINFLCDEVHRRLKPLLNLETSLDLSGLAEEDSSSNTTPRNSDWESYTPLCILIKTVGWKGGMGRQDPLTPFNHANFKVKAMIKNVEQIKWNQKVSMSCSGFLFLVSLGSYIYYCACPQPHGLKPSQH
ncbi:unnamed protein product [Sphenostylis stenocarpa]|uniref:Uncharacterized protein n=1 Tax=Sphenostylis stenocarpa TaxID=92480 RepID=A0AA86TFM8_9FABA|nr:unnamed protein product [Sphenostylis stenocarpa]